MFALSQNMLAGMAIMMTVNKGLEAFKERCNNNDDGDDENGDNFDGDEDYAASGVHSGMQQSPFFFAHPAQPPRTFCLVGGARTRNRLIGTGLQQQCFITSLAKVE